jgi:hypothetical protein
LIRTLVKAGAGSANAESIKNSQASIEALALTGVWEILRSTAEIVFNGVAERGLGVR